MRWRIELLGGLRVQCGPRLLSPLRTRKAAALLAYLAFHRGSHERETLAELLWPETDPLAGRNRLRVALSALRASLQDDELIDATGSTLTLHPECETDVGDFVNAVARAKMEVGPAQIALWQTAFDLYGGRLLPGFFESWIPAAEAELEENFVQTARALMAQLCAAGQHPRALEYGRRALSLMPLREELCGDMMQLHADSGHSANALRLYRELEHQLREQLQTAPSPTLRALNARLLAPHSEDVTPDAEQIVAPKTTLLPATTQRPPDLSEAPDLPPQWTRFFGRQSDIDNVRQSLGGDQTRLVTLTGGGGLGKTRLALQSARILQELWPRRVWFVPLHEVWESGLVAAQIQRVLGLPPQRDESAALEIIAQTLNAKPALLVLDNFEQLLPWATPVVQWLLDNAPHLRLLVTSRAPLKIEGETVLELSALTVPDRALPPAELMEYESVQLFADRARIADPRFRLTLHNARSVAELCAQLEGWPLALELAGAQALALRPHQMLKRLRKRLDFLQSEASGASHRHASLRAVLEWSYELLQPDARRFFARLSVFRGGFDAEAACEIGEEPEAAHLLRLLMAASLVVSEDKRFRLLETIREFGREQLSDAELEALQRRHARYFLGLARAHHDTFVDANDEPRMSSLARSHLNCDNLRAALHWSLDGEPETALALVVAMSSHWGDAFSDAGQWAQRALENAPDAEPKLISAALGVATHYAAYRGDHRRHRELALRRLELVRALGDDGEIAWAYFHVGSASESAGDYGGAAASYGQSLNLFEARQDGSALERQNVAWTLNRLGVCAIEEGDLENAERYFRRALADFRANEDRDGEASELSQLAHVLTLSAKFGEARALFERADQLERDLDDARPHPWRRFQRGLLAWNEGELAHARAYFAAALRGFDAMGEIGGLLDSLLAIACLLVKENNYIESLTLLSCETAHREARELPLSAIFTKPRREALSAVRAALGDTAFEANCARGRKLQLPAAMELALQNVAPEIPPETKETP